MASRHESETGLEPATEIERVDWPRMGLLQGDRKNRAPWPPQRAWMLVALPLLGVVPLIIWGIVDIEGKIEDAAPRMLEDAGIDPSSLRFEVNYRDVKVSGRLPPGATAAEVERVLEQSDGPGGEDIREAAVTAEPAPAASLGEINVRVTADGETIVLTGTVPSVELRDVLVAAAERSGLGIVANITNSGLSPSAENPGRQIAQLARLLPTLDTTVDQADLAVGDAGPVTGSVSVTDRESADWIERLAGDGVSVNAPAELGAIDLQVTFDGVRIVLTGEVVSEEQSDRLAEAAFAVVSRGRVVNNIRVLGLDEAVPGSDDRVAALARAVETFDGLLSGDARLDDTDLTLNGEAVDPESRAMALAALEAAARVGLRPGGDLSVATIEVTLEEEIELLQAELDALQKEILETVVFSAESDALSEAAQATLDKVVAAMTEYQNPVVEVGGHTDSLGPEEFNQALSQLRADAVAAYLTARGVDAGRVNAIGYGESLPVADNDSDEGRAQNRRVEFTAQGSF